MNRSLPEKIVAAVEVLAEELAGWCQAGRDQTLGVHEDAVLERVRRVLPVLLQAVVEVATSGLDGRRRQAREACPRCEQRVRPHGPPRRRQIQTRCGTVALERPWRQCGDCKRGGSTVETTLGVAETAAVAQVEQTREAAEVLNPAPGFLVVKTVGAMVRY